MTFAPAVVASRRRPTACLDMARAEAVEAQAHELWGHRPRRPGRGASTLAPSATHLKEAVAIRLTQGTRGVQSRGGHRRQVRAPLLRDSRGDQDAPPRGDPAMKPRIQARSSIPTPPSAVPPCTTAPEGPSWRFPLLVRQQRGRRLGVRVVLGVTESNPALRTTAEDLLQRRLQKRSPGASSTSSAHWRERREEEPNSMAAGSAKEKN